MERFDSVLVTGIAEIDEQHLSLFEVLRKLQDAIGQKKNMGNIEEIFLFLEKYSDEHFTTEEGYMQKYRYPEIAFHQARHRDFSEQLTQRKRDFIMKGEAVQTDIGSWLYLWYRKHILAIDKVMCEYILSVQQGEKVLSE